MPTIRSVYKPREYRPDDPLNGARGLVNGVLSSAVVWIVVGVIVAMFMGGWMDVGSYQSPIRTPVYNGGGI